MTDDKTLKLMYADTNASGVGDRVIIRASGTELLGISSFIDNGVYKGEVSIGTSITCLLYTSPSPRDRPLSRMPSSA